MLRKSSSKRAKALSFKPKDSENQDIYTKVRKSKIELEKEKDKMEKKPEKEKIIFMNDDEKEGYCVNKYDNGDSYFGYYSNDVRNYHGFYYYNPKYVGCDYYLNRYYLGLWKNDLRHGFGIYLWSKGKRNSKFYESFDNSNFIAYAGIFNSDNLEKGTYLSKEGEDYFVYHGTFAENCEKEGQNCYYYSANLEQLFYGTFHKNEFIDGYIAQFNDEGEIEDIIKYDNGTSKNLENNEDEENKELMNLFRDCIMSEDYFGNIYEVFSRILKFKDNYLFDIDIINTDKYEDFLDICKSYKKITIFNDIEKYVKID